MVYPEISEEFIEKRLALPAGKIKCVSSLFSVLFNSSISIHLYGSSATEDTYCTTGFDQSSCGFFCFSSCSHMFHPLFFF